MRPDFVGVVTAKGFEVGTAATISNNGNAAFSGIVTSSGGSFSGNVTLPDNAELKLGSAGEVRLLHTGSVY